jgi:hypothetical protein
MSNKLFIDWKYGIGLLFAVGAIIAALYASPPITKPPVAVATLEVKEISRGPENAPTTYAIIEIDECEYIVARHHMETSIVHKANCKNPIHIQGAKLREN